MDACKQLLHSLESAAEAGKDADTPQAFWKAVVAKVFDPNSVGLAPATVPLSARGFFDGSETGGQPPLHLHVISFGCSITLTCNCLSPAHS